MDKKTAQKPCSNLKHLVLILDGSRRWARKKGISTEEGYRAGANALLPVLRHGWENGIHTITAVMASTNNVLKRPKDEFDGLYRVCVNLCDEILELAQAMKVRVNHIGRKERIPSSLREKFCELEAATQAFDEFVLNIAFDYGARDEIVLAVKEIIKAKISAEDVTDELIGKLLYTSNLKYRNPELIIRTGGVSRLSGLLCWDYDYSELYFPKKYWPDFTIDDLIEACSWFNGVERREGK